MLPQDTEAELGLLCSILLQPREVMGECIEKNIKQDHFHVPAHATIFTVLRELYDGNKPFDFILLTQILRDRGLLNQVGGPVFVTSLFTFVPTAANASYYLDILKEKQTLREIITTCMEAERKAYEEQDNVNGILGEATTKLSGLTVQETKKHKTMRELTEEKLDRIENGVDDSNLISTGFEWLDKNSPLRRGDMPVIAAEAKSGKTIFSSNVLGNIAKLGKPTIYFSLESPANKIYDLLFRNESSIPAYRQHVGQYGGMTERDFTNATKAAATLSALKMTIVDDIFDCSKIVAFTCREKVNNPDLAAIVVDYLQLVRGDRQKGQSREQEIAGMSRALRLLSMELNIAVIVLSQLNKDGDTRESKAIEQDCTALWKLMRCYDGRGEDREEISNERMLLVPFQRDGDSNIATKLAFIGELARFAPIANEEKP